eukprot:313222-Prorocentrum_minimum.AAC.2
MPHVRALGWERVMKELCTLSAVSWRSIKVRYTRSVPAFRHRWLSRPPPSRLPTLAWLSPSWRPPPTGRWQRREYASRKSGSVARTFLVSRGRSE